LQKNDNNKKPAEAGLKTNMNIKNLKNAIFLHHHLSKLKNHGKQQLELSKSSAILTCLR